jgi:ubiquinone/menaquinone biosynthesis C-methylase UbiE
MSGHAADFSGGIPEHYDRHLGSVLFADYADDIAQRVAISAPARVLELAAGTGIVTRRLRDRLPVGTHLTATDLNPPMLAMASAKFQPGEQVDFQQADATALPFPDGAFDAVVCQFGIMFFSDKDKSYREVHRVLAPNGRYLFNVWNPSRGLHPTTEVVSSFFPSDPPQFYKVPFSYYRLDPIKESLEAAGFIDLRIAVITIEKEILDAGSFARGLIYGNPIVDEIRKRGGVTPDRVVDALKVALCKQFGDDPGRMTLQAIVIEATRR